jgi:hypothetical protein
MSTEPASVLHLLFVNADPALRLLRESGLLAGSIMMAGFLKHGGHGVIFAGGALPRHSAPTFCGPTVTGSDDVEAW